MNDAPVCFRSGDVRLVKHRHVTDCRSRDCDGCVECLERHCCIDGRQHLEPTERQACPGCVGRIRRDLVTIVDLVALAESDLDGWPSASSGSGVVGPRGHEPGLPGGDTLALISPGSAGTEAFRARMGRWDDDLEEWFAGDKRALDHELPSDPPSVLYELSRMENEWRIRLGHGPVGRRDLTQVHRYLDEHLPEAIQHPDLFPDDAKTIRWLRAFLEAKRGDSNRPMRGVKCFDCDTTLTRALRNPDPCGHQEPIYVALPDVTLIGHHGYPHVITPADRRNHYDEFVATHTAYLIAHMGCDQGGFADQWECTNCGVTYDKERYWRAVGQTLQQEQNGTQEDAS